MRSTVDIPEKLMNDAQALSGLKTKREIVVAALEEFIRRRRIEQLRARLGKGNFDLTHEELERMRADVPPVAPERKARAVHVG